ncbi:MAG TPA: universal stress protein [Candidatus Binatia bacterium]|jgi:universal stress protein A|nr:universal stress protein [Candidatus Binatia bacterium]
MSFKKILIAVDESAFAARAVDVGFDLARSLGAQVALIYVVDPSIVAYAPESGIPASELVAEAQRDARRLTAAFTQSAALQPPPLEFIHTGKPPVEIVGAAKDWPADLIVIGSHGRGGVERLLLGSVAEAVMRHASCPVLVVRAEE